MNDFNQQHQTAQTHSKALEAILHASETALSAKQLCHLLQISPTELDRALIVLQQRLAQGALTLAHTATGYRLQIANEFSPLIRRAFPERRETLSQAVLETLSVIAYRQPVTRGDIEQVRGVTVSSTILRQLFDKGWIVERDCTKTHLVALPCSIPQLNFWQHLAWQVLMTYHHCCR